MLFHSTTGRNTFSVYAFLTFFFFFFSLFVIDVCYLGNHIWKQFRVWLYRGQFLYCFFTFYQMEGALQNQDLFLIIFLSVVQSHLAKYIWDCSKKIYVTCLYNILIAEVQRVIPSLCSDCCCCFLYLFNGENSKEVVISHGIYNSKGNIFNTYRRSQK